MKRVSYIVFGIAFLALASCQKEAFRPGTPGHEASEIEWKSDGLDGEKSSDKAFSSAYDKSGDTNGNTSTNPDTGDTDNSGITDPNNDPDAAKKKGKK